MMLAKLRTRWRNRFKEWLAPGCDQATDKKGIARLDRAEKLHKISALAVKQERKKQTIRVSDMRIAANSAVGRLRHDLEEIKESGGNDLAV